MDKNQVKNEILEACKFRHACKVFNKERKVSDEDFKFILEVARLSPSSFGIEPWKFIVIENEDLKNDLKPACYGATRQLSSASHFVIVLARKKQDTIYSSKYVEYLQRKVKNLPTEELVQDFINVFGTFEKNANLFESDRTIFDWACKQTYIAVGNMMSAAAQIGIDSCAMEGFTAKDVDDILEKHNIIDKNEFGTSCLLSFGYREAEPPFPKTRNPIENIVSFVK